MSRVGTNAAPAGSPAAPTGPMTRAQLRDRLLTTADVPPAWTVSWLDPVMPDSSTASPASREPFDCSKALDPFAFLSAADTPAAMDAESVDGHRGGVTAKGTIGSVGIQGLEHLWSYTRDGAHRAFEQIRGAVAACPTGAEGPTGQAAAFSVAPGPALGDESLIIRERIPVGDSGALAAEGIVIRVDSTLVILHTLSTSPANAPLLETLAEPAVRKLG